MKRLSPLVSQHLLPAGRALLQRFISTSWAKRILLVCIPASLLLLLLLHRRSTDAPASPKPTDHFCRDNHFLKPYTEAELRQVEEKIANWTGQLLALSSRLYNNAGHRVDLQPDAVFEPLSSQRFEGTDPLLPCRERQLVGTGEGGRYLCSVSHLRDYANKCTVYTFGILNGMTFEVGILDLNPDCQVEVFDCTVKDGLPWGFSFHQLCIDGLDEARGDFISLSVSQREHWISLASAYQRKSPGQRISVMRMDIEGYEFPVIQQWKRGDPFLPDMLVLELHVRTFRSADNEWIRRLDWVNREKGFSQVLIFFVHLMHLGYVVVSKTPNAECPHCCEYVLLRVYCWE